VKVVFDAYWWVQGPAALRHVLRELVLAWVQEHPEDEIALVVRTRHLQAARASTPPGVRLVPSRLRPQALLASLATERVRRRLGYDALVVHNFAARSRGVSTVYLHDVMFETDPQWFTRVERAYFSRMVAWVRRADVVLASSAAEGRRIARHTRARRVVPVGLGLSTELLDGPQSPVADLAPGFLLTVGRLNVRKNLGRTISGVLASGVVDAARPLVVVGARGGRDEELAPEAEEAVADGRVRFLGHVDEAQLRWLYANARLFCFLSLGEGFGMPPVEALAFGTPVVASDLEVFRENLPAGTRFVDPLDVAAVAAAVRAAAEGPRPDLGEVARTVVAAHDWRRSVGLVRQTVAGLLEERRRG
jgi:glycosyltransferase involved in cell wall biosynthesis